MCTPRHARHGHDDAHARDHRRHRDDDARDHGHGSSNHHRRHDGDDDAHAPLLHEAS